MKNALTNIYHKPDMHSKVRRITFSAYTNKFHFDDRQTLTTLPKLKYVHELICQ